MGSNMSTKRESASIDSSEDHKRQKTSNDASVKDETKMEEVLHKNLLPSIVVYLAPRDLLNCLQTSKKWKEEIDTEYVWNDILLPSLMLHHPPRDISKCIQASKKWKDKIDTVDTFWEKVVNITVPPKIVDLIGEITSRHITFLSASGTKTMNYESIALAFDLKNNKTIEGLGGLLLSSLDDIYYSVAFDLNKTVPHKRVVKLLSSETVHGICSFLSENPRSVAEHGIVFTTISNNSLNTFNALPVPALLQPLLSALISSKLLVP